MNAAEGGVFGHSASAVGLLLMENFQRLGAKHVIRYSISVQVVAGHRASLFHKMEVLSDHIIRLSGVYGNGGRQVARLKLHRKNYRRKHVGLDRGDKTFQWMSLRVGLRVKHLKQHSGFCHITNSAVLLPNADEENMNKSDLIDALSTKANITKTAAGKVLDVLLDEVMSAVAQGDSVSLIGFGTFKQAERAAREGKNPKTGAKIMIPAATVPKFSAGSSFKDRVAAKK